MCGAYPEGNALSTRNAPGFRATETGATADGMESDRPELRSVPEERAAFSTLVDGLLRALSR
jgi:hypothetical protein